MVVSWSSFALSSNVYKFAETVRKCRTFFGGRAPSRSTVVNLINTFETIGSIKNPNSDCRTRTDSSFENTAAVESANECPSTSMRHCSQQLDIPRSSMQRTLAFVQTKSKGAKKPASKVTKLAKTKLAPKKKAAQKNRLLQEGATCRDQISQDQDAEGAIAKGCAESEECP